MLVSLFNESMKQIYSFFYFFDDFHKFFIKEKKIGLLKIQTLRFVKEAKAEEI